MKFALILVCVYEYLMYCYNPINRLFFEPLSIKFENVNEKKTRNKMVVAVDFDGTIAKTDFPKIIKPIPYAFDVLRVLMNDPYTTLILWTCREGENLKQALDFCELYGIKFDYVNENDKARTEYYGNDSRKIGADLYIDDKSYQGQEGIDRLWCDWWNWMKKNELLK